MKLAGSLIVQGILSGFFISVFAAGESPSVIAYTRYIEGHYKIANNGRRYEAYEGIPYAKPPVGELRFEPPELMTIESNDILSLFAKNVSDVCMQYDEAQEKVIGSEDCLYLNVYRPDRVGLKDYLLPVIFYIHGNDFQSGSGGEHGPKYLMDRDVILVTFNYRLGALGFLSTEDDVVPGNMGLKDQVLALDWVKDNIENFNGDPDNVSIFGHGAGGASVHYHYLTELTLGLFSKGMSLSGTALAPWAQTKEARKKAIELAELVNCPTSDVTAMVKCLKNKPADNLVESRVVKFRRYMKSPFAPFGPVAEKSDREFTFIKELPSGIITSSRARDLPWITGFVDFDALAVTAGIVDNPAELDNLNTNWSTIAPDLLEYRHTVPKKRHEAVARTVREHYYGSSPIATWNTVPISKMIGDRLFAADGAQAALLQAQFVGGPIRFYRFSYSGADSFSKITAASDFFNPAHGDDLAYVFDLPVNMSSSEDGRIMRQRMIDLWVSYAEDKDLRGPEVGTDWSSINPNGNEMKYLHILQPDDVVIESSRNIGQNDFWQSLGFNENSVNVAPV